MLRWLRSLLGISSTPRRVASPRPATRTVSERWSPEAGPGAEPNRFQLPEPAARFLVGLITPSRPFELQELAVDDRLFLSGIMKMIGDGRFEVPVLPSTAIEITRLMGEPFSTMGDFARVIRCDPALSVQILQVANSAFYGFCTRTSNLHDAIFRIGTQQVRTIVIFTHLKGKVLQAGQFQSEVGWLSGLSAGMASLAKLLAGDLKLQPDAAFTLGMLSQLEHFVILGTLPDLVREQKIRIQPSGRALHEAFRRFGWQVRDLAIRKWQLQELLMVDVEANELRERYDQIRCALISHWTGAEEPAAIEGVPPERLTRALEQVGAQSFMADERGAAKSGSGGSFRRSASDQSRVAEAGASG